MLGPLRLLMLAPKKNYRFYDSTQRAALHSRLQQAASLTQTVCAVGDSITEGTDWDNELLGRYPGIVQSADMGVSGDTSNKVYARISTIKATNANLYLLAVGVNDIRYNNASVPASITVESYVSQMALIINELKATGADVFVISIWPSFRADQTPATTNVFGSYEATNNQINLRNKYLRKWCIANGVGFVNSTDYIRGVINTEALEQLYSSDGIHPNALGRVVYANGCIYDPITVSPGTVLYDTFDRSDAATLTRAYTGQLWENATGTVGITSNKATPKTHFDGTSLVRMNLGTVNLTLDVDFIYAGSPEVQGIMVRSDGTTANRIHLYTDGNTLTLRKVVSGVATVLGTYSYVFPVGSATRIRLDVRGNVFKVYINGVERINVTDDNVLKTLTNLGLLWYNASSVLCASQFDNMQVVT